MFLNSNKIKNRKISSAYQENYFLDDDRKINFEEVLEYYHKETKHFTNSVYEGTNLNLILKIKGFEKNYEIQIDSNKEEKYQTIYNLSKKILKFRQNSLLQKFRATKNVTFKILNKDIFIEILNDEIYIRYYNEMSHYKDFKVEKIILKDECFYFSSSSRKEKILAQNISDKEFLFELIDKKIEYKKQKKIPFYLFIVFVTLFGLNGWFDFCCMNNLFVEVTSTLSSILLLVWIVVYPLIKFVVQPINDKKIKENE